MKASVGPLTARPPTSGLTATTGPGAAAIASRIPGTARIGPIEITGFEGPTITTSALGERREDLGGRARLGDPVELDPLDRRLRVVEDQELLQPPPARRGPHPRADRLLGHRQHRGVRAQRAGDLALGRGQRAALGDEVGAVEAGREVAVGEREPARGAELLSRSWTVNVSSRMPQPRSSSIWPVSQYVHRSGSGQTSRPWASASSPVLAITASSSPTTSWSPAASFAPPVPPARDYVTPNDPSSGKPGIRIPAWVL